MDNNLFGIILKVSYESIGDTSAVELLGKTCLDWVSIALDGAPYKAVAYDEKGDLPLQVRPYLDLNYKYTAVLFSDTPLITKKTVAEAVLTMQDKGLNVLKMTRGYIFSTAFLHGIDKMYAGNPYYFDEEDFITVFSNKQASMVGDLLRLRIIDYHSERGVRFTDINSCRIDADAVIGKNVEIGANNLILGNSVIKDGAKLLYNNVIDRCIIDEKAEINSSRLYRAYVGERTTVGPFAYIRPDSVIGPDCRIGDFVEIKKSIIGAHCKVSHLSYVGDTEMGEGCNIGCGVVFVNYDGKDKHRTKVGNRVFVGSNSNIVAPVVLSDGAYIAAGSTITGSVPQDGLAIARARQVVKTDWLNNKFAPRNDKQD